MNIVDSIEQRFETNLREILVDGFFEAFLVFLLLSAGIFTGVYIRVIEPGLAQLDQTLTTIIFSRALEGAVFFTVSYRLTKWGILSSIGVFTSPQPSDKSRIVNFLTDTYLTLATILTLMPVRPILQKFNTTADGYRITQAFVQYDAIPTILLLSILGLPLLILIITKKSIQYRKTKILLIILAAVVAGYTNMQPNFDARIYEARASWVTREWEKLENNAQKALEAAETDQQKAISHYWLGVAANRQDQYIQAKDHQLKAIEFDKDYGPPYSSLSSAYRLLGQYEDAKVAADKCIEYSPDYAWCYYALGAYYYDLGNMEPAFQAVETAHKIDPYSSDIEFFYKVLQQEVQ